MNGFTKEITMNICIDSNILVYAFNSDSNFNNKAELLLEQLLYSQGFVITDISLIEFYQIITNKDKLDKHISPKNANKIISSIISNEKIQIIEVIAKVLQN